MSDTGISLTIDKRINIISAANLVALVALLVTALSTWFGLVGKVDLLNSRIDAAQAELVRIRGDVSNYMMARDADTRALRDKTDVIGTRLTVVETKLTTVFETVQRIEQGLHNGTKP